MARGAPGCERILASGNREKPTRGRVARGEDARKDNQSANEVGSGAAQMPRQAEFDTVGEQGAFVMRFEYVVVAPEGKRAVHPGIDKQARGLGGFPASGPAQDERPLPHGNGEFVAGACRFPGADFQDAEAGRRDAAQVVRVLVEAEQFLRAGRNVGRAGENRHGNRVEAGLAGGAFFSLLQWVRFANKRLADQTYQNLMSDKPIEERVKEIIVKELSVNPEQVTPTASFIEDLGADSLDTVELVMAFEEEFGVEVPDEEAEKLQTVGDVVKYIEANSSK